MIPKLLKARCMIIYILKNTNALRLSCRFRWLAFVARGMRHDNARREKVCPACRRWPRPECPGRLGGSHREDHFHVSSSLSPLLAILCCPVFWSRRSAPPRCCHRVSCLSLGRLFSFNHTHARLAARSVDQTALHRLRCLLGLLKVFCGRLVVFSLYP